MLKILKNLRYFQLTHFILDISYESKDNTKKYGIELIPLGVNDFLLPLLSISPQSINDNTKCIDIPIDGSIDKYNHNEAEAEPFGIESIWLA